VTPGQAIHRHCVACAASPHAVKDCGGDKCLGGQGDERGVCWFFRFRLGRGRPSVRLIRRFSLECMGGSSRSVAECAVCDCTLFPFRFGKSPARAGLRPKFAEKGRRTGGNRA
jgi:hypothetical protein